MEIFPRLLSGGGFELMRTCVGSRSILEPIPMPTEGYTSYSLAEETGLGQAICFIRPIQKDLEMLTESITEQVNS